MPYFEEMLQDVRMTAPEAGADARSWEELSPEDQQKHIDETERILTEREKTVQVGLLGADGNEVSYAGYARVQADFQFKDGSATEAKNARFPLCTGGACDVAGVGVFDAEGRLLFTHTLASSVHVEGGTRVNLSIHITF